MKRTLAAKHLTAFSLILLPSLAASCNGGGGGSGNGGPSTGFTAPVTGDVWGGMQTITWNTPSNNPGTVDIRLSSDGGSTYPTVLDMAAPDTGSYAWDTTAHTDGPSYRLRIIATDANGDVKPPFFSPGNFIIDNTAPTIAVAAPVGGENWGGVENIVWMTSDANPGTVAIRLSSDSGATYPTVIATSAPDTGTYAWDSSIVPDGTTYRISITPTDAAGNLGTAGTSPGDFIIDNTAPTVVLTSPLGGGVLTGIVPVTWITTDDYPSTVELRLSTDSGATFPIVVASSAPDTGTYMWASAAAPDGTTLRMQVIAIDASGNASAPSSSVSDFALENVRVVGEAAYEDVNDNGVLDSGDRVLVTFDEPVVINSNNASSFELFVAGDSLGTGAVVEATPGLPTEVRIVLGTGAHLKSRQTFDPDRLTADSPSGIDVSTTIPMGAIQSDPGGIDVSASVPVNIYAAMHAKGGVEGGGTPATLTSCLATGDIDGDGDTDFVAGADDSNPNRVYKNDGTGLFTDTGLALGASGTLAVALGDLDGDGDLDLVAGNAGALIGPGPERMGQANEVYLNTDGNGTFVASSSFGNADTRDVALGDLDGDGDLDIITANFGSGEPNGVWLNDGTGAFTPTTPLGTTHSTTVSLGDFDSDGDLDLFVGNDFMPETNRVWLNNGLASFIDFGEALNTANTRDSAVGDFDADGDLDIAVSVSGQNQIAVNNGAAVFTDALQFLGNADTRAIEAADMDGDGHLDLVAGNFADENQVWRNDGTGVFSDLGQTIGTNFTVAIALLDSNGDGDVDFVEGNSFGAIVDELWTNSLSGTWGGATFVDSGQALGSSDTRALVIGDVNRDGNLDSVTGNSGQANRVWLGVADGTFVDSGQALGLASTEALALGDVNGDGTLDLVEAIGGASGNRVWTSNTAGTFTDSGQSLGSSDTRAVLLADVDLDGDRDIVAGNAGQADRVWINPGTGAFVDSGQTLGSAETRGLAFGDVDGDGDGDIVAGNRGGANRVWLNDGSGTFTDSGQAIGSSNTEAVVLGDIDGDGDLDLVEGIDGSGAQVWKNDGSGTFSSNQSIASGSTRDVLLRDVNGDGAPDLVIARTTGEANLLWFNNGSGTFVDSGQSLGAESTEAAGLADVDHDGDLDLITGNGGAEGGGVWLSE